MHQVYVLILCPCIVLFLPLSNCYCSSHKILLRISFVQRSFLWFLNIFKSVLKWFFSRRFPVAQGSCSCCGFTHQNAAALMQDCSDIGEECRMSSVLVECRCSSLEYRMVMTSFFKCTAFLPEAQSSRVLIFPSARQQIRSRPHAAVAFAHRLSTCRIV